MKHIFLLPLMVCLLVLQANAQTSSTDSPNSSIKARAAEGDSVWVIINHIKPDKREQFEKFVHEVFWPKASNLSADEQRLFKQTRVLHPTEPEADGTYSYIFLMDPLIPGGNYEIDYLLKKIYGEGKWEQHSKMLGETFAREQTQYVVVQSKY